MSHFNKYGSYSLSYISREDTFSTFGDGRCGVGPRITHFYSQKFDLIADSRGDWFQTSQRHFIASTIYSSCIMGYSVGDSGDS